MKIRYCIYAGLSILLMLVLFSCVDNNYDFSDIDTTSRFKAKNLVVPLNIEELTLDQVLDLDKESEIKQVKDENGDLFYAIKKEGRFTSDDISVKAFTASKPSLAPCIVQIPRIAGSPAGTVVYQVESPAAPFKSEASNLDEAFREIRSIGVEANSTIKLRIAGEKLTRAMMSNVQYQNLKIQYPKGLTVATNLGTYDPSTGVLDLTASPLTPNSNGEVRIQMDVTAIDATQENVSVDYVNRTFTFEGEVKVIQGNLNFNTSVDLPDAITFIVTPEFSTFKAKTMTGRVEFEVENLAIDPVDLSHIPDAINQSGTRLMVENPQLYLKLNNPMADYDAYFETGIRLTSIRDAVRRDYEIDHDEKGNRVFNTTLPDGGHLLPVTPLLLAPTVPAQYYEGYDSPKFVPFSSMREVLVLEEDAEEEGVGIPATIQVHAIDPAIPEQDVTDLELGKTYGSVKGDYAFFAPLQLSDDSRIVYTDKVTGWDKGDMDGLTIDSLIMRFDGTTDLPFEIKLSIQPIDKEGNVIEGVTSTTVTIAAMAKEQPIEIKLVGPVTHLDGLLIEARAVNQGSETILGPEMTIYVKNCKATVTGFYDKEL